MCVCFLKTVTLRVPSSLRVRLVSRKGREPSFSSSMVNLMVGRTSLRWRSRGSTASLCIMQHVSSTYRFQNLGLEGADSRASSSKNSMYRLATTAETGTLNVTVFRKQTHTDRYLHFNSHHPASAKRAAVRSLFDRARNITLRKEDLRKEEEHLTTTFRQNGYPLPFIRAISSSIQKPSAPPEEEPDEEPDDEESQKEEEKQPLAVIPYVSGVSERIRKACEKYNLKVVFKSGPTLRSLLTRVKDPLPKEKLAGVVYQIPCQCGKVYVGETQRRLETRVKEHRDACNKGDTGKSAIAEHQWDQQHQVNWEDTRVLDRASRPVQLRVKEALYIQKTPTNNRLNRDEGYELPGCWIATVKKLGGGVSPSRASANRVSAWTSAPRRTACARKLRSHAYKLPSISHLASLLP